MCGDDKKNEIIKKIENIFSIISDQSGVGVKNVQGKQLQRVLVK